MFVPVLGVGALLTRSRNNRFYRPLWDLKNLGPCLPSVKGLGYFRQIASHTKADDKGAA